MTPRRTTASLALAALLAAGCSDSKSDDDGPRPSDDQGSAAFAQTLKGTWVTCTDEGAADRREVLVFDGARFVSREYDHPTADGTCGGNPTLRYADGGSRSGTYTVGAGLQAPDPEGAASVTAYRLDATVPPGDHGYTIAYVKTSVTPNVLYMGDDSGALDGKSPENRPSTLQAGKPRTRAAAAVPFPASLQGSFESCVSEEGFDDQREVLTLSGTTLDVRQYRHPSRDGSCQGNGRQRLFEGFQASFTVGSEVEAALDALVSATVQGLGDRAFAVDVDPEPIASAFYSILWVDALASRRTLYVAEPVDTPEARPTVLEGWKPRYLLPPPAAFPAILDGSWESCTFEADALHDVREVLEFAGGTFSYSEHDHATIDGTCGGTGTPGKSGTATFTAGAEVATTLGALDVAAHELDLVSLPLYTIVYVDALASPPTLYLGDDRTSKPQTPEERPLTLQDWKPRFRLP